MQTTRPTSPPPARREAAGLVLGAVPAIVVSGGLVAERISAGDVRVALVVNAIVTFTAVLTLRATERLSFRVAPLWQAVGALLGISMVHLWLRFGGIAEGVWLVERPAQLVNDVVAVGVTLILVWACARGMSVRLLVVAIGVMTVYRATGQLWHLDTPPHGFILTVQQLMVAQLVALAIALMAYEAATADAE